MPEHASPSSPRGRFDAVVESNTLICREHYRLRLRVAGAFPPTQPGQFIQLGCRPPDDAMDDAAMCGCEHDWRPGERITIEQAEVRHPLAMLRRPFSLAGRGDDADGTWLEVIHRVVGVGTEWLAQLAPGDRADLIGPLGNIFALTPGKLLGLLVGGGVGLPPMFYLAESLRAAGWDAIAFVGAMSRDLLAVTLSDRIGADTGGAPSQCVDEFSRFQYPTIVTTNDGSCGLRGLITAGLEKILAAQSPADAARTVLFTCGPDPMMHAVAKLAAAHGVECQACLEQAMACGMGTCQSCVVRIEDRARPQATTAAGRPWRYRLACTDGPVFQADSVVW